MRHRRPSCARLHVPCPACCALRSPLVPLVPSADDATAGTGSSRNGVQILGVEPHHVLPPLIPVEPDEAAVALYLRACSELPMVPDAGNIDPDALSDVDRCYVHRLFHGGRRMCAARDHVGQAHAIQHAAWYGSAFNIKTLETSSGRAGLKRSGRRQHGHLSYHVR